MRLMKCARGLAAGLLLLLLAGAASAAAIYPIDRARIVAGSRFDLKIEFDRIVLAESARVTINGADYATVLGKTAQFVENDDGANASALTVLSRNPEGFVLMVEAGLIDKYNHPLDWERSVYHTIMLANAVQVAKDWAAGRDDTLIIVTPDHTHGVSIVGTIDDAKPGPDMREKVGVYQDAGFPNYPQANANGYPDRVDVSKRLAMFYGNFPDYYETYRPKLDGPFVPSVRRDKDYVANERYKDVPGAVLRAGNLPRGADTGTHTADDALVTAMGPGSEEFRGFMENVEVFRVIVGALGLGRPEAVESPGKALAPALGMAPQ